jgi:tetratricopeptide (TPR) repeat protein/tRNA A-37 threonylcarbamoyl transferase component Bud32
MADESFAKVREIFEAAYGLPPEERPAYLDRACGRDGALRDRVDTLLAAAEQEHPFLSEPTGAPTATTAPGSGGGSTPVEAPGSRIGRYKLLEQIGEGGFGTVFMAEQEEPVHRRVALKIIKPGMDSKQVIARFEAERQALAMMDHPCIARVLDAGETDLRHPYFVMELVRGEPITEYCDQNDLTTGERLDLFTQVCHAVQHAHQKGVIHRDIKPSNVLITVVDGRPIPKVIDFGIAKATESKLTELTLFTEHRALIGTPAYMSPEQAVMSGVDVDTRSDIYSLGVLLYELLTGTTPFDTKELMAAGLAEIQRIIREVEPEKPSTRLSTLKQTAPDGARRPEDTGRLSAIVRGDLDWIVMKAMEKDRSRRYETASGLAADVKRHLAGEAVVAAPPSRAYRARKFVRRHRAGVMAASLVVLSLAAGVVGTTIGLVRAERQRARAEANAESTQQAADFQARMLSDIDVEAMGRAFKEAFREEVRAAYEREYVGSYPDLRRRTPEEVEAEMAEFDRRADAAGSVDIARNLLVEFVLEPSAEELRQGFADQPLVGAFLHRALAQTYWEFGLSELAEPHVHEALELMLEHGESEEFVAVSQQRVGVLLTERREFDEAERLLEEAKDTFIRVHGRVHRTVATVIEDLGNLERGRRDLPGAKARYEEAMAIYEELSAGPSAWVAVCLKKLASVEILQRNYDAAEERAREALEMLEGLPEEHPLLVVSCMNTLAISLRRQGDHAEAESWYERSLENQRGKLGVHPAVAVTLHNLGLVKGNLGKVEDAERYISQALDMSRQAHPRAHPATASYLHHLAEIVKERDTDEAERLAQESLAMYESHPKWARNEHVHALSVLTEVYIAAGRREEAAAVNREGLEVRRGYPEGSRELASSLRTAAELYRKIGYFGDAVALYRDCLTIHSSLYPDGHPRAWTRYQLMSWLGDALVREASATLLADAERSRALLEEAEPLLLDGYTGMRDEPALATSRGDGRKRAALASIVMLYETWHDLSPDSDRAEQAARWRAELERLPPP